MAHIPEAITLDVFGPPEPIHLARLHRLTEAAGVGPRVRFRSAPRAELLNQYRAADVVVFPSEWREPFGIVPLEAMASGAVVVATGVGGSGDYLVDGENCVLFEAGDATALAAAVARVAGDAALRERLIDGGLATAARLTIAATADRLEQLHLETARAGHNTNVR
jgi:glycosyltransferase involved in cell wall biosynthesis